MKLLFLCHNHPSLQPGGTEVLARNLFRELRDRHQVEGVFLAAVTGSHRERRPGTMLQGIGDAADEMLVWLGHFDRFFLAQPDTYGLASLLPLVAELAPDVIHLHHALLWGVESIDLLRRAAPRARFIFTAHDFFPLCPQEGQMLTTAGRLCGGPSLDACQGCFPGRPGADFVMRELQMRDVFRDFDRILTPSAFARNRYIAAGWPAERIEVMPNGLLPVPPAPHRPAPDGRRDRIGFFGHLNRFKGSLVLLAASRQLEAAGVAHRVTLHGGAAYQSEAFMETLKADLAATPSANWVGPYTAAELPGLIAKVDWVVVPSIWWENAPLVIQEAFLHRRPVICGGIGGMAEMVRDGVDGLHAPVNDPVGLAQCIRNAVESDGLWERLVARIEAPPTIAEVAKRHLTLYQDALEAVSA
ncbi:glycosyltransferase family 4 protein [Siccirubricoccus sp. KC 17139]|uniref:Glycosyltransferase family 4 protein n=1 Tax=Siccirubricoccus soli TaxID=2899147 RepID=A0ABT1D6H0_9PROT|nr:glycosyltransferase family 4 protein [Siccirubricoccus soli]MCO6417182.1 glycosyltransferase family 4 protein [Siccirubricoccus soli]MCP2683317.1 glycosyltransferase family 4 protein [Siccirubricoccus soli]